MTNWDALEEPSAAEMANEISAKIFSYTPFASATTDRHQ